MKAETENQIVNGVSPRERAQRPVASGTRIGHVHLKTADIDRAHHFYVDILGFDVIFRMPDALFLSAGGYHHHLGLNTSEAKGGSPPPPAPPGWNPARSSIPPRPGPGARRGGWRGAGWPRAAATAPGRPGR